MQQNRLIIIVIVGLGGLLLCQCSKPVVYITEPTAYDYSLNNYYQELSQFVKPLYDSHREGYNLPIKSAMEKGRVHPTAVDNVRLYIPGVEPKCIISIKKIFASNGYLIVFDNNVFVLVFEDSYDPKNIVFDLSQYKASFAKHLITPLIEKMDIVSKDLTEEKKFEEAKYVKTFISELLKIIHLDSTKNMAARFKLWRMRNSYCVTLNAINLPASTLHHHSLNFQTWFNYPVGSGDFVNHPPRSYMAEYFLSIMKESEKQNKK